MNYLETESEFRPFYWLVCDNSFPIGQDLRLLDEFKAYLKHALLFHRKLLISDALIVNTPNLRKTIQDDIDFRNYLQDSCLQIARRKKRGSVEKLVDLRDHFRDSEGVTNVGFENRYRIFTENSDLEDLEKCAYRSFNSESEAEYFTQNVRNLVKSEEFQLAMGVNFDCVQAVILKQTDGGNYIDHRFLSDTLPDSLGRIIGADRWAQINSAIKPYVLAYYHNTIPALVGSDVIFSKAHKEVREVLRNTSSGHKPLARVDLSRENESLYASVVAELSAGKLRKIRESDQFNNLQSSLLNLRRFDSIDAPDIEQAIENVYAELRLYHNFLDRELSISRFYRHSTALLDNWRVVGMVNKGIYTINLAFDAVLDPTVKSVITNSLKNIPFGWGINIIYDGVERIVHHFEKIKYLSSSQSGVDKPINASSELIESMEFGNNSRIMDTIYK